MSADFVVPKLTIEASTTVPEFPTYHPATVLITLLVVPVNPAGVVPVTPYTLPDEQICAPVV